MPKIDEVKEFIGFLKAIFILLIVINTSLIAWIFKNFESESIGRLYIVVLLVFLLSLAIGTLFSKILQEIKRLKDL
jgi:membrane protein YdbS with pleckstrin-like domain